MQAIRTEQSNFTYLGPTAEVADLPVHREDGAAYAVFRLTDEEREMIAAGAQLEVGIHQHPIPPVSIKLVKQTEAPSDPRGRRDYRCERCANLYIAERAFRLAYQCGHCGGKLRLSDANED